MTDCSTGCIGCTHETVGGQETEQDRLLDETEAHLAGRQRPKPPIPISNLGDAVISYLKPIGSLSFD